MDNALHPSAPGIADLPDPVRRRLLDKACTTDRTAIELVVCTAGGWPSLAHLSVGELLLGSDGLLRMALWRDSRTCAALREQQRGSLFFAGPDQLLEIHFYLLAHAKLATTKPLTGFLLAPVQVRDKRAPYATVTSGLQFRLHDAAGVRAAWRAARNALVDLFPPQTAEQTSS
jgi:hypothetical protein